MWIGTNLLDGVYAEYAVRLVTKQTLNCVKLLLYYIHVSIFQAQFIQSSIISSYQLARIVPYLRSRTRSAGKTKQCGNGRQRYKLNVSQKWSSVIEAHNLILVPHVLSQNLLK